MFIFILVHKQTMCNRIASVYAIYMWLLYFFSLPLKIMMKPGIVVMNIQDFPSFWTLSIWEIMQNKGSFNL